MPLVEGGRLPAPPCWRPHRSPRVARGLGSQRAATWHVACSTARAALRYWAAVPAAAVASPEA
eukprot:11987863-Alexandrium_andersonii.AAC.1